jgi:hypothetical protein
VVKKECEGHYPANFRSNYTRVTLNTDQDSTIWFAAIADCNNTSAKYKFKGIVIDFEITFRNIEDSHYSSEDRGLINEIFPSNLD